MKAKSTAVKKRINRGNISSDDPLFEEQLLSMDVELEKVKKQVLNKPRQQNNVIKKSLIKFSPESKSSPDLRGTKFQSKINADLDIVSDDKNQDLNNTFDIFHSPPSIPQNLQAQFSQQPKLKLIEIDLEDLQPQPIAQTPKQHQLIDQRQIIIENAIDESSNHSKLKNKDSIFEMPLQIKLNGVDMADDYNTPHFNQIQVKKQNQPITQTLNEVSQTQQPILESAIDTPSIIDQKPSIFIDKLQTGIYLQENENTNFPVLINVIQNSDFYMKSVTFVESKAGQRGLLKPDKIEEIQSQQSTLELKKIQFIQDKRQDLNDIIDSLGEQIELKQIEDEEDSQQILKQIEKLLRKDLKPSIYENHLNQKSSQISVQNVFEQEKCLYKFTECDINLEKEQSFIRQTEEQNKKGLEQLLQSKQQNDAQQFEQLEQLIENSNFQSSIIQNEDDQNKQLTNLIDQLLLDFEQISVQTCTKIFLASSSDLQLQQQREDVVKQSENSKEQLSNSVKESLDLDKELTSLRVQLSDIQNQSESLSQAKDLQLEEITSLEQHLSIKREELSQYQSLYEKQISFIKNQIQDTQTQESLLQTKQENLRREREQQNDSLKDKQAANLDMIKDRCLLQNTSLEEDSVEQESLLQQNQAVNIINEIESLISYKVQELYPQVESNKENLGFVSQEFENIRELDKVNVFCDTVRLKKLQIEDYDLDVDQLSNQICSHQFDIASKQVINQIHALLNTENNLVEISTNGITRDQDELYQITEAQRIFFANLKLSSQQLDLDQELILSDMLKYQEISQSQDAQILLQSTQPIQKLKQSFDQEARDKYENIIVAETQLNSRKNELKQLEQIQKRKDDIINDLEIQAGKSTLFSEKTNNSFTSNAMQNRVDEAIDYIVSQGCKVPIHKIGENYYQFGTRKLYIKEDARSLEIIVRDKSGKCCEVYQYIREHEDLEYENMGLNRSSTNLNQSTQQTPGNQMNEIEQQRQQILRNVAGVNRPSSSMSQNENVQTASIKIDRPMRKSQQQSSHQVISISSSKQK